MGSLGDDDELLALDAVLGTGSPATVYLAAFTAAPDDTGGGTEVTGGSYARVPVTNDATNFPAATTVSGVGTKVNGLLIAFPTATADWGNVSHWAIMDDVSAGVLKVWGEVTGSPFVGSGSTLRFGPGALVITGD